MLKRILSLLLIFTMFDCFVVAYAHESGTIRPIAVNTGVETSLGRAIIDAEHDAAVAADPLLWMVGTLIGTSVVGCLFCGLPAIGVAYISQPSPPAARLMGKSPEYVMLYTQTYKEKIRSHQVMGATIGCVGGSIVAAFVWSRYYSGEWSRYYR